LLFHGNIVFCGGFVYNNGGEESASVERGLKGEIERVGLCCIKLVK
jgi:hypothetical protein